MYKLPLAANPRAKMMGHPGRFREAHRAHRIRHRDRRVIVAPKASELIYPLALAAERRLTVDQVSRVFAAYPSLTSSITDATRAMHQGIAN